MDFMDRRKMLAGVEVTFSDGRKGTVVGAVPPFVAVATLDGRVRHEYTVETVERIVRRGGLFPVI